MPWYFSVDAVFDLTQFQILNKIRINRDKFFVDVSTMQLLRIPEAFGWKHETTCVNDYVSNHVPCLSNHENASASYIIIMFLFQNSSLIVGLKAIFLLY